MKSLNDHEYIKKTHEINANSELFKVVQRLIFKKTYHFPLQLDVLRKTINIEDRHLCLTGQEKIYRLFLYFYSSPQKQLSRTDLLEKIYAFDNQKEISYRQKSSLDHNIVKLISRARKLAATRFREINNMSIEWFPYDKIQKKWHLYKLKHQMLCD